MSANLQSSSEWTTKKLLEWTTGYLRDADIEQPRLCAELLLAHVLDCQRIELYTNFDYTPTPDQLTRFRTLVKRCQAHEPVSYLLGRTSFYSMTFQVGPGCLTPRPETEILVAEAIRFCTERTDRPIVDVLELGTGSACIAAALAAHVVETEIIATDISPEALDIAQANLQANDLQDRVTLRCGDWFSALAPDDKSLFDLILSNPPYISDHDYRNLPRNVHDYEPALALRAGPEGLDALRAIIEQANDYLADRGALMLEIAYDQGQSALELLNNCGYLSDCRLIKDHAGLPRVVRGVKA